jgi:hypothetical protein
MNNRGAYKKKERNLRNMKARYVLLDEGLKSPQAIKKSIARTLVGQRMFCSLALPNTDIEPISLNTFKALARELYSSEAEANGDGFAYMDAMRGRLNRLVEVIPSGRSVKAKAERSEQDSNAVAARLDAVELQNVLRSKAYLDIVSKIGKLVKDGEIEAQTKLRLLKLLSDHQAIYGHLFNPSVATVSDGGAVLVHLPLRGAP